MDELYPEIPASNPRTMTNKNMAMTNPEYSILSGTTQQAQSKKVKKNVLKSKMNNGFTMYPTN